MDEPEFLRVTTALQDSGDMEWSFDLTSQARTGLNLNSADEITRALGRIASRSHDLTTPIGVALQQPAVSSPLDGLVGRARTAESSIAGPVGTLSVTGVLVALVGVLAAAVYGIRRRRTEVRLLNAIGISWLRLGTRFVAEAFLPLAAGAVLGWLLADRVVGVVGPSSVIEPAARSSSGAAVATGFAVALIIFGLVAAVAARVETESASSGRIRSALSGALWEIPVLILAGAALYEIVTRGTAPIEGANGTVHIDRLFLLFPVLFIAGLGGLAVRLLSWLLARLRTRSAGWPVAVYLAYRRLASAPRVALLLVTASTLAVGILAYAGTVVATVRSAAFDKTMVAVGADVGATHGPGLVLPPAGRPEALTNIVTIPGSLTPGGARTNVIAVDPSTFAQAAFWDPSFSGSSLPQLMQELSRPVGSAVPMLVVNGGAPPGATVTVAGYPIPVDVVDELEAFPGEHPGVNIVVSATVLRQTLESHGVTFDSVGAAYQTWARGNPGQAVAYFKSLGISPQLISSASARLHAPDLRALSWAFGFMEVLGAVTALVALIGLVLYLQARQRGREMTFALSSRMGLSSGAHLVAIAMELVCILLAALVLGAALATGAAALVYRQLDPLPSLPPGALLRFPFALIAGIAAAMAISTVAGAWIVQQQTQRANIAKVMRFAD
jgi:putative ABC transport system permease protein